MYGDETLEDDGSASAMMPESEEMVAARAAFNGELPASCGNALANSQRPANASAPRAPFSIKRDTRIVRTSTDDSSTKSPVELPRPDDLPPSPRLFVDFGGPTGRQSTSAAARHRSGGEDRDLQVDGSGAREEEEGMEQEVVPVVNGEVEETPVDPTVDTATPEQRQQRKQARWYYHRVKPDVEESLLFKEFAKLNLCCNKQILMRSSATQTGMGSDTLKRKINHNKRRREVDRESRRIAQAVRRDVKNNPTLPVAAAIPSAVNSNSATGNLRARPGVVHPPTQQQQGTLREVTPNPKRRRRQGKTP